MKNKHIISSVMCFYFCLGDFIVTFGFQCAAMRVKRTSLGSPEAAPTSVSSVTDTRLGRVAAVLDLAWAVMASPAKVSTAAVWVTLYVFIFKCKEKSAR